MHRRQGWQNVNAFKIRDAFEMENVLLSASVGLAIAL